MLIRCKTNLISKFNQPDPLVEFGLIEFGQLASNHLKIDRSADFGVQL